MLLPLAVYYTNTNISSHDVGFSSEKFNLRCVHAPTNVHDIIEMSPHTFQGAFEMYVVRILVEISL